MLNYISKFISIGLILLLFSLSLILVNQPDTLNKVVPLNTSRIPVDESNCTDTCTKKPGEGVFFAGGPIDYNLVVTNTTELTITTGVTLTDFLNDDFIFESIEQQGWRCDTPPTIVKVNCTYLDTLPPGATSVLTLNLTLAATAGPTVTNHVHFGFQQLDGSVLVYSAEVDTHLGTTLYIPLLRRSSRYTGSGSIRLH